jgi:hypothetical protein
MDRLSALELLREVCEARSKHFPVSKFRKEDDVV